MEEELKQIRFYAILAGIEMTLGMIIVALRWWLDTNISLAIFGGILMAIGYYHMFIKMSSLLSKAYPNGRIN